MPITFNFLIQPWEFEYREREKKDQPQMIVMAHTEEEFIQELKNHNLFDQYLEDQEKNMIKIEPNDKGQMRYKL